VNSPLNIYAREAQHPPKGATAYCSGKTGQRLADRPCPLAWQLRTVGRCRGQASPSTSTPHVGRHGHQVKLLHEATSPRIILSIIHLSTKNAWEPKRTPRRQEEDFGTDENVMKAPTDLHKSTISCLGPTSYVNLLLNVKVIS
jgi:hypothetical protein